MASFKLLLLFTVVSFLSFSTTEAQDSDSRSPNYLHQNCSINKTTAGSAFQLNIGIVFSSLISNATANSGFYNATVSGTNPSDTVYGLFMCRGDVPSQLCRQCVLNATQRLSSQCSLSKEAVIWYDECMVRYSSRYFFSTVETSPMFVELNTTTSTLNPNFFTLSNTLDQLIVDTRDTKERYKAESLKLNALQTLYILAQCTLDLSSADCTNCLTNVIGSAIPWARLGSASGGRVLYPSCNTRFELFQFYRDDGGEAQPPKPASPSPSDKRKRWSRTIILIVVPTCALGMLFYFGYYLWRKKRKSYKTILVENFGHESATLERLQFELAMIEGATNNFSHQNLLGKGHSS